MVCVPFGARIRALPRTERDNRAVPHVALILAAALAAAAPDAGSSASTPGSASPASTIYRVELAGGQSAWAIGRPQPNGALLLFRHYPDGALMSVRRQDVRRLVAWSGSSAATSPATLKPGQAIEIGATGGGAPVGAPAGTGTAAKAPATAPFNPNRPYNPTWDSKLVPGANLPYPASKNDYVEGKTFSYPPAPAVQSAPGDVPRAPEPH